DSERPAYKHVRSVRWLKKGQFDLPEKLQFPLKTLTPLTEPDTIRSLKLVLGIKDNVAQTEESPETSQRHWWINANPKIWNFSETPIGGKQVYTSHNEQGNKRQKYKYFQEVKRGDLIVGYVTSPDREIVAIARVTKPLGPQQPDGAEGIEFE